VEKFDIGNYDINAQDFQVPFSNETRMGVDTLKPAAIQLTINYRKNFQLANVSGLVNSPIVLNFDYDPTLGDLQREWRAPETLSTWGALKPLYYCREDGTVVLAYGRPGKFAYTKRQPNKQHSQATAEFRRSDTLWYSETEWFSVFDPGDDRKITRTRGDATAWIRALIIGPATIPILNFGPMQLQVNYTLVENQVIELSTYPWNRRIIDLSTGYNLSPYFVAEQPFLDKITYPYLEPTEISWHATGTTANSKMVLLWHDAYQVVED
jgi:hypothetical protein